MPSIFFQSEIDKASKLGFIEGSKGLPAPDATTLDLNEAKFYAKAISFLNKTAASIAPKITSLTRGVSEIGSKLETVRASVDSLRNRTSLEAQIESRLNQSFGAMVDAKRNQLLREAELNAFKLSNNLVHPAIYPTSFAQHMSWVAITLTIETIINAAFFSNASGYLVGALIALGVAGLNLGFAFIGGLFFRGKNSVNSPLRIQAWGIFLFLWALIVFFNLLTATYRSEAAEIYSKLTNLSESSIPDLGKLELEGQKEAFIQALSNLTGIFVGEFPFSDLNGLILMLVGLLAAVIGMWKGYSGDDPYPRYGIITRSAIAASKAYAKLEDSLRADAQIVADCPRGEIGDARQTINSIKQQVGSARRDATDVRNEWQQKITQLRHEYVSIVDVYRKSVRAVKPNPSPAYFDDPVDVPDNQSMINELALLDTQVAKMQSEIEIVSEEGLPFLAVSEQSLNEVRARLLGVVMNNHIDRIVQSARGSI
jgi:hypothetical protein